MWSSMVIAEKLKNAINAAKTVTPVFLDTLILKFPGILILTNRAIIGRVRRIMPNKLLSS